MRNSYLTAAVANLAAPPADPNFDSPEIQAYLAEIDAENARQPNCGIDPATPSANRSRDL